MDPTVDSEIGLSARYVMLNLESLLFDYNISVILLTFLPYFSPLG